MSAKRRPHQTGQMEMFSNDNITASNNPITFPVQLEKIVERVEQLNPVKYSKSRNFINGAVTYLSPYIARGVVSLNFIKEHVLSKYKLYESEKLIQELGWREYFQRVWQHHGNNIFTDLKQEQQKVKHHAIPKQIIAANSGIQGIDNAIDNLYRTGYMHNHCRMYAAMLTCNIAQSHWELPSKWMYYHLLDGDIASNTLSWQWVAGAFSSKKYYANQENINKYCFTAQQQTFLDTDYETIADIEIPEVLQETSALELKTPLPAKRSIQLDTTLPLYIYNSYNLDPLWHKAEQANRVLLLEPAHFDAFPVSEKVLQFIIDCAVANIPDIQIFIGNYDDLMQEWKGDKHNVVAKEHPASKHYDCTIEQRDWMFPQVSGYYPSFFGFWKKAEHYLK